MTVFWETKKLCICTYLIQRKVLAEHFPAICCMRLLRIDKRWAKCFSDSIVIRLMITYCWIFFCCVTSPFQIVFQALLEEFYFIFSFFWFILCVPWLCLGEEFCFFFSPLSPNHFEHNINITGFTQLKWYDQKRKEKNEF